MHACRRKPAACADTVSLIYAVTKRAKRQMPDGLPSAAKASNERCGRRPPATALGRGHAKQTDWHKQVGLCPRQCLLKRAQWCCSSLHGRTWWGSSKWRLAAPAAPQAAAAEGRPQAASSGGGCTAAGPCQGQRTSGPCSPLPSCQQHQQASCLPHEDSAARTAASSPVTG